MQCLLSTQCSAVLEVAARASQAAATRLSWTQASWVVLSLAAEWGGNHPSPPTCSQLSLSLATTTLLLPPQQLRKWQIVQQISPETAVTVININITKKGTQSWAAQFLCRDRPFVYFNVFSENRRRGGSIRWAHSFNGYREAALLFVLIRCKMHLLISPRSAL